VALGVDGVRVGVWTHPEVPTGCTVVLPPEGTLGAIAVRGQSPGTREAAALGPFGKLTVIHGVVLAGGSAYGLSTADGVVHWLEEQAIGYPIGDHAIVPIVGAAIVLDMSVGIPGSRPDAAAGRAACETASDQDPPQGAVGAGAGCTVAKIGGLEHGWRGGQGIAVERVDDLVVGALVVNNAVGEVVGPDGEVVIGSRAHHDVLRWPAETDQRPGAAGPRADGDAEVGGPADEGGPSGNTVIGVVVTNARLDKSQAHRVADLAHDGVARAVEPAHTSVDGDALFCLATGQVEASLDRVALLAARAVATATRQGPMAATGLDIPDGPLAGTRAAASPNPFAGRIPGFADNT